MPDFSLAYDYPAPPASHGSACAFCGSNRAPDEACLNTGLFLDVHDTGVYGLMHICASCVVEMGRLVGMIDPAEADRLREQAADADAVVVGLRARLAELAYVDDLIHRVQDTAKPPAQPEVTNGPVSGGQTAKPDVPCPDCDKTFTHPLPLSAHRKRAHA